VPDPPVEQTDLPLRWCADLARTLDAHDHAPGLPPGVQGRVLRIARDVAHGTERRNAPLATFIAGQYVQRRTAQGISVEEAMAEVEAVVARLLAEATARRPLER
jgi:hypothetical protein